ncbi:MULTISPECIES: chemotaxis protein CheD [unclassified Salinivibrio]|uniref:chemotaxis protein CheD n=1 Tax=unclassified Salinivibrio TaxID=2636825 RepID=UPI00128C55A2|nr:MULTISPECIES: chemotaxis protein CheD [unclassified Salinivibrio]MPS32297.1 chemotaxis protein CheD [Salinivibrio sp. VYel7]MPX93690.1 chemotaxis protein CheD [Salinivibrio sp. VYel9]MPX96521.1 chemotaxis protein CheD [Salinivibrio sp. VYel6]MPX99827.1 chemotaxis protein CheD [Salinivibrio sp. VYel4]MPY02959.1 chemotaxis protein CheD [Salinivibrio sp. VYel5]
MHQALELHHHAHEKTLKRFFSPEHDKHMVKLQPGDVYVSSDDELIATGLGSCIAACIWDPLAQVGGMNHFMLPLKLEEAESTWTPEQNLSRAARYGNYAMEILINSLLQQGAVKNRLRVKLFGGGNIMGQNIAIGRKNIDFVRQYVINEQLPLISEDLGLAFPRRVLFEPRTGKAWVKKIQSLSQKELVAEETQYNQRLLQESYNDGADEQDVELF